MAPLPSAGESPQDGLSFDELAELIRLSRRAAGSERGARCLHARPHLRSAPEQLAVARGSFLAPAAQEFSAQEHHVEHGLWMVDHFPQEHLVALHFVGRQSSVFAEVFLEDIAATSYSSQGPDLTVEVITTDGDYFVLAGRRRGMRRMLKEFGLAA